MLSDAKLLGEEATPAARRAAASSSARAASIACVHTQRSMTTGTMLGPLLRWKTSILIFGSTHVRDENEYAEKCSPPPDEVPMKAMKGQA
jgi:hypothetical protein